MQDMLLPLEEVVHRIEGGRVMLLSGEEGLLRRLPRGKWIAGTIPYFVTASQGGMVCRDRIFATDLTDRITAAECATYDRQTVSQVYTDGPRHGLSVIIVPAACETHLTFAVNAPTYEEFAIRPLVGWVSGLHLGAGPKEKPKVYNGLTGEILEDGAVVLHASLPADKVAEIGIINLFEPGGGDILMFPKGGFTVTDMLVNGMKRNFAAYLTQYGFDTKVPLVADYYGAHVNCSIRDVDEATGEVSLYAPVFPGMHYKLARPVTDYVATFRDRLKRGQPQDPDTIVFSCNCILNYLYSELEGKKTDPFYGPVTIGEIAYQLLNQTLVFLKILDSKP